MTSTQANNASNPQFEITFTETWELVVAEQSDHCLTQQSGVDPELPLVVPLDDYYRLPAVQLLEQAGQVGQSVLPAENIYRYFSSPNVKSKPFFCYLESYDLCCASHSSSPRDNVMLAHSLTSTCCRGDENRTGLSQLSGTRCCSDNNLSRLQTADDLTASSANNGW